MTSRTQICGETRNLGDSHFVTTIQQIPLADHSSSPLRLLVSQSAAKQAVTPIEGPKIGEPDGHAKYPESLFDPPSFGEVSDYLISRYHRSERRRYDLIKLEIQRIVPRMAYKAPRNADTSPLRFPKSFVDLAGGKAGPSTNITGAMERCEGLQSLIYSVSTCPPGNHEPQSEPRLTQYFTAISSIGSTSLAWSR